MPTLPSLLAQSADYNRGSSNDQLGGPIQTPISGSVNPGLPNFISNIIRLALIGAGLLVLFNFILAGYDFITASGDPKKVSSAVEKMWQSLLGLLIMVGAVALIWIIEKVVFKSPGYLLQPTITGPGTI